MAESGTQWRVSENGGSQPRWSPDGRTVLYQDPDGRTIHAATLRFDSDVAVVSRRVVATVPGRGPWDVDRKTGRMVVAQAVESAASRMIVIVNWLDWLRRTSAGNQ